MTTHSKKVSKKSRKTPSHTRKAARRVNTRKTTKHVGGSKHTMKGGSWFRRNTPKEKKEKLRQKMDKYKDKNQRKYGLAQQKLQQLEEHNPRKLISKKATKEYYYTANRIDENDIDHGRELDNESLKRFYQVTQYETSGVKRKIEILDVNKYLDSQDTFGINSKYSPVKLESMDTAYIIRKAEKLPNGYGVAVRNNARMDNAISRHNVAKIVYRNDRTAVPLYYKFTAPLEKQTPIGNIFKKFPKGFTHLIVIGPEIVSDAEIRKQQKMEQEERMYDVPEDVYSLPTPRGRTSNKQPPQVIGYPPNSRAQSPSNQSPSNQSQSNQSQSNQEQRRLVRNAAYASLGNNTSGEYSRPNRDPPGYDPAHIPLGTSGYSEPPLYNGPGGVPGSGYETVSDTNTPMELPRRQETKRRETPRQQNSNENLNGYKEEGNYVEVGSAGNTTPDVGYFEVGPEQNDLPASQEQRTLRMGQQNSPPKTCNEVLATVKQTLQNIVKAMDNGQTIQKNAIKKIIKHIHEYDMQSNPF